MKLVEMERANIDHLAQSFKLLPNVEYVDLVSAMQKAASTNLLLYPPAADGHPMEAGNRVIAAAVAPAVGKYMVESPLGLVGIVRDTKTVLPMLATKDGLWMFSTKEIARKNGWDDDQIRIVNVRDIAALPVMGTINVVDPKKFGPRAIRPRYAAR